MEAILSILSRLMDAKWPAAILGFVVFALLVAIRQWREADRARSERERRRVEYDYSEKAYLKAMSAGDAVTALKWKNRMDELVKMGLVLVLAVLVCGCRTRTVVTTLWLSDYARTIAPGETVPSLPEGESCWWLMSAPRGLEAMMPKPTPMFVPVSMPEAEDM